MGSLNVNYPFNRRGHALFCVGRKPGEQWNGKPLAWSPITSPAVDSQMWLHLKDDAAVLPINDDIKRRLAFVEQLNVTLAY